MRINLLSDYIKFKKFFGVNGAMTAAITQAEILKKYAQISINSNDECNIINSHGCMPYTYYKMMKYKKKGIPIVIYAHQTHYDTKNAIILSKAFIPIVKWFLKKYYSKADLLIAPVENAKNIIKKELSNKPIKIIRNGINTENFSKDYKKGKAFRNKLGLKRFTVLSVGMPVKRKGIDCFIDLAKELKDIQFLWIGKPAFPLLQKMPKTKLNNLIMPGYVKDLQSAYSSADVFCFPSRYEGQGLVILEAASAGLPIIIRDLPTYDGWLIDGKNCLKAKTDEEFINKIKKVKHDKILRNKLIKGALRLAKENDINLVAKKLIKTFEELIRENKSIK